MHEWQRDLGDSAFEFQRVVWPRIQGWCGGGELMPVEAVAAEGFTKQLDVLAGIDAWQIHTENGIRGIASRVQWDDARPDFPYCTFTIRKLRFNGSDTEYKKRVRALNDAGGWLYPYLTSHAYVRMPRRSGALAAVAIAKTRDIVEMIGIGNCETNQTSNASFWVVSWDAMRRCGFDVKVWPREPEQQRLVEAPSEHKINWG